MLMGLSAASGCGPTEVHEIEPVTVLEPPLLTSELPIASGTSGSSPRQPECQGGSAESGCNGIARERVGGGLRLFRSLPSFVAAASRVQPIFSGGLTKLFFADNVSMYDAED